MLDIRKTAAENQGLVNEVAESLKVSKEIVEKRVKLASLKENKFEVFTSATKGEIERFMDILKTVDPDFNTAQYLDTKKKFHMTGLLLLLHHTHETQQHVSRFSEHTVPNP